jgi:thiol:disulfide interchange protein
MKLNKLFVTMLAVSIVAVITLAAFAAKKDIHPKIKPVAEKGILFIEQDWNKALQQAKAQKKLIFLDIYATWCGPCKMLKKNTFSDPKVAAFFNKNFINITVDGEKSVGPDLARKFSIEGYPTLIVADGDGNPVAISVGYIDDAQLLDFGNKALAKRF